MSHTFPLFFSLFFGGLKSTDHFKATCAPGTIRYWFSMLPGLVRKFVPLYQAVHVSLSPLNKISSSGAMEKAGWDSDFSFLQCIRWHSVAEIRNNLEYLGSLIHVYIKPLGIVG